MAALTRNRTSARDGLAGARAMVPWLIGVVPFGLVIGVSAAQADIPAAAGWLTGPLIFAGSAQVAVIDLLNGGAAAIVVIAAALTINSRLVLYSTTMAPHWQNTPRWWRALAAYLLIDPSFAVGVDGYDRYTDTERAHRYYLGGAATLWFAWMAAMTVGSIAGASLTDALHLDFVIPLFLIGEVAARVPGDAARRAAFVSMAVALVSLTAPFHLGP